VTKQTKQTAERQLIKRGLLPEDMARTVLLLAAEDSSIMAQQSLIVDAGLR
jgi:NAD(P)-dependent dehydrogenase (short-subunit alcohol dehydrogenase family)